MKTITITLAALLLAGTSSAALAQQPGADRDHDRDRGDRAQGQPHAQGPQAPQGGHVRPVAPPSAAPAVQAAPGAPGRGFERRDGQARDQGQRFQGQQFQGQQFQGQRFQGQAVAPVPAPAPRPVDRGGPVPNAGRQFDRERGPREVIPPGVQRVPDRGFDARRDSRDFGPRADRDGRRDGDRRDRDRRDGDRRDWRNPWRGGEHWQAGRAPPVFWSQDRFRIGPYRAPYGYYVRTWGFGDFLPRGWFIDSYWIGDFLDYGLPYPPPGYVWVRVGPDALMVDRYTGRIVQVVRGIFW